MWPRALALAVAVVWVALVLKVAPPLVVLLVFVGAMVFAYATVRRIRDRERRPALGLLGLERADGDAAQILASALSLFGRVGDAALTDVVRGRWRSVEVWAYTLSFTPPASVAPTGERPSFSCAMAVSESDRPGFVVEPQAFLTALGAPAPGLEVRTGHAPFDDAMNAWGDEPFALEFLGPDARTWLRSLDHTWGLEVRGRLAVVYGPALERSDPAVALEIVRDLVERLTDDRRTSGPLS